MQVCRRRNSAILLRMKQAAAPEMTAEDLTRARALLGVSRDELAAEMGLTEPIVRAWEEGSLRIPRQYAVQIAWRAAVAERQAALASSGLPDCTWVTKWMDAAPASGTAQRDHLELLRRHAAVCPVCTARARFIESNFPPMPDPPLPAPVRMLRAAHAALQRLPRWLRPTVVGSVAFGAFSLVRLATLIASGEAPSISGALLLIAAGFLGGAYLGAVAGIAYGIVRDPLRRLGRLGDYLAGILCTWVYILASVIPMQLLTGRPAFSNPTEAAVVAAGGAVIGVIIGHLWFRRR